MHHLSPFLSSLLALAIIALCLYWHVTQVRESVTAWATRHRYKLLDYRRVFLPPWPPAAVVLGTRKSQVLVSVRIYDETTHRIRHGWLRLGSPWWGLLNTDAVDAYWADE